MKKSKKVLKLNKKEILEKAESEGVELTNEQLDKISGGWVDNGLCYFYCEKCNAEVYCYEDEEYVHCTNCGFLNGPFEDVY